MKAGAAGDPCASVCDRGPASVGVGGRQPFGPVSRNPLE